MSIDEQEFRRVVSHFAAGVTVVTTCGVDGLPYGLTATAFTAVSLQPPLVLVCVDKRSESHPHFHASKVFAVNFLGAGHEEISRRFAVSGGDKFSGCAFRRGGTGAPILDGVLGHVECRTVTTVDAGDHTVFLGQVESASANEGHPLVYFRSHYRSLVHP